MNYSVQFAKDRQKFSAAHFTIFCDGSVERLHGHNYVLEVGFSGNTLDGGLLFPFHDAKALIKKVCDRLDEYMLIPAQSPWVRVVEEEDQCQLHLQTPLVKKFYSFPREDVIILPVDNISCENLVYFVGTQLVEALSQQSWAAHLVKMDLCLAEGSGQKVCLQMDLSGLD